GQFAQRVAIKLLHGGAYSAPAREALLRERRILGRLDHPHIARLYDGGVTDDGVPYFVMEHVDGRALDQHCDEQRLTVEARLRVFIQVCQAVEYAHGRLVVHRDLKPSNVLVDAHGDVKLLDFGIAKVLEESAEITQTALPVFTPVYAAPEQLRGEPITTATDVYQLGLLLYELLTGLRAQGGPSDSVILLHRRVVEIDPERPSRVTLTDEVARGRGSTSAALARRLEGDLDAIVLKALRKEPAQRYPTVGALRQDLERFLDQRPVLARRGTGLYRLRKYVRRNRLQLAAAALVVASLAGGLIAASRERDRARLAEAKAGAINEFLVNELLSAPTPEKTLGQTLTVADVLDNASRSVGHAFGAQPDIEAELRLTLARTYGALGRLPQARTNAQAAHDLLAAQHGAGGADTLRARRGLAELAIEEGQYAEAQSQLEAVQRAQAQLLGSDHPDTLETTAALSRAVRALGDTARAEKMLRQALAVAEARHPARWRLTAELQRRLVDTLVVEERGLDAEAICRKLLEQQRQQLGPRHPQVAQTLLLLANALYKQARYPEAVATYEELVALDERLYGPEHPATADALAALAAGYDNGLQRYADAARAEERAHAIYAKALGPDHPKTLKAREGVGITLRHADKDREAEALYREVLAARQRVLGPSHPDTIRSLVFLNELLLDLKQVPESRQFAKQAIDAYEAAIAVPQPDPNVMYQYARYVSGLEPEDMRNPQRALAVAEKAVALTERKQYQPLVELGNAYELTGQPDQAIATLREALALPEASRSWTTEGLLVAALQKHRPPEELERFLRERIEQLRAQRGPDDPMVAKTIRNLALHYQQQARAAEAERAFQEVLAQLRKSHAEGNWEIGRAKSELGGCLAARGAYAEAEPLLLEGYKAVSDRPDRWNKAARERLVKLYEGWGRPADAERWKAAGSTR
ncbi:MAG TPA: serine/threonine-protein kinase, partial [Vicinamibacteria bacterium]